MPKTSALILGVGLLCSIAMPAIVVAQTAPAPQPAADGTAAAKDSGGLQEIVVTAQKRAQRVQDVPIAVTALSGDALKANRVTTVSDLSGLAPGMTIRTAAGGSQLPSFSMRGAISYGVVPGSDKEVSMYLDGVYISSPRGAIFDLPDVERIEVLRGPQGTLFGRNSTAGAVSVTTRDPTGKFDAVASGTIGNQDSRRYNFGVDLPQVGPFSAYVSYVHDERRGDIRNAGAGTTWDRTASLDPSVPKIATSPEWLGSKDADSWFAAVKFESGNFKTVYKFDHYKNDGTPEGTSFVGYNPSGPVGNFLTALIGSQAGPVYTDPANRRPDVVNNSFIVPSVQNDTGHNVTSSWRVSSDFSIKNIFAHRQSFIYATSALAGFDALPLTAAAAPYLGYPASAVGSPWVGYINQVDSRSKQTSDELQFNYNSGFLTATAGALWFESEDYTGQSYLQQAIAFSTIPNYTLPNTGIGYNYNKTVSIAAYSQLEFHVTPKLNIILGGRVTHDKKTGSLILGDSLSDLSTIDSKYEKTKPTYLVSIDYKPTDGVLVYAKFSDAFVSGGAAASIPYQPETVKSVEGGIKSEFFDRKLRANLAVYYATYKNYQAAEAAINFQDYVTALTGNPALYQEAGLIVVSLGGVKARGFEFELTAAPTDGLTMGGSLSYSKVTYNNLNSVIVAADLGQDLPSAYRPKWNGTLWAQYDTRPVAGDSYLSFRADGIWQSKMGLAENPAQPIYSILPNSVAAPAYWVVNSRIALKNLGIGRVKSELALWGRNLFDNRSPSYELDLGDAVMGANYIPARAYGVDLTVRF